MSNITPTSPSFVFGYWRPWKENSNAFDSYLDYVKDKSLVKYGADTVGKYISQASKEQVTAINQLGQAIGQGMNVLSEQITTLGMGVKELEYNLNQGLTIIANQLDSVNANLTFINRNLDIQIEQQRLSNLLLQNINELLRVPDSEKERQHSIELGIKFFVNANKDSDLYSDALEELLKAESLMKQDYFVLHRIGCIYLYVEKYLDPAKALDYFQRAAKYASVESDPKAIRLANALTNNFNAANTEINNDIDKIQLIAADSFEKASFASYVLGDIENAVNNQGKAVRYSPTPQNYFLLAKYQIRNSQNEEGVKSLNISLCKSPALMVGTLKEIDLINSPDVLKLLNDKNESLDEKINQLLLRLESIPSEESVELKKQCYGIKLLPYHIKISEIERITEIINNNELKYSNLKSNIEDFIKSIKSTYFYPVLVDESNRILGELSDLKMLQYEKMKSALGEITHKKEDIEKKNREIHHCTSNIDKFINEINKKIFCTINEQRIASIKNELLESKRKITEKGKNSIKTVDDVLKRLKIEVNNDELRVGSNYAGGIVFFIDDTGKHGLVCASQDFGEAIWGQPFDISAKADGIGGTSGLMNTKRIVEMASWVEEKGFFRSTKKLLQTAARFCLESNYNGYNDWYLPCHSELRLMYNIHKMGLGNFRSEKTASIYWSSTETNATNSWGLSFYGGNANRNCNKSATYFVRAVRAF
jgi:hypothetical protein